jgi:AraC family transcriptional regulator
MNCDLIHVAPRHQIESDVLESFRLSPSAKFLAIVCDPGAAFVLPPGLSGVWCPLRGEARFTTLDCTVSASKGFVYTSDSQRRHEISIPTDGSCVGLLGAPSAWSEVARLWDTTARQGYTLFPALHQVNLDVRMRLIRIVREMVKLSAQPHETRPLSLLAATLSEFQQAFEPFIARCPGHSIAKRRAVFLRLQRARNHMSFGVNHDLSVKDLAVIANYSVWRFIKVFFMVYGETPYSFMSRNRIDRAASLLKGSNLAIGDVAIAAGFDSRASFSRAIKRRLGSSATDFREFQRNFAPCAEPAL